MRRAPCSEKPVQAVVSGQFHGLVTLPPRAKSMRFARNLWGDQTLEQRMPSFLEAALFEPEAEAPERSSITHPA